MRRPAFESLTRELLEAGVAPRFAHRLRRELEDHYRELEREALQSEPSPQAAAVEARRRLGSNETIAREVLNRPELRSWIYRSRAFTACLRGLCRVYLWLRAAAALVAPLRPIVLRFAAAGLVAAVVTGALLLVLGLSVDGGMVVTAPEPRVTNVRPFAAGREIGAPSTSRAVTARAAPTSPTSSTSAVPAAESPPARTPLSMPDLDRPPLPRLELYDVALRVEPRVAVDVELRPDLTPDMRLVNGDLLPIVKVTPRFPSVAARRGIEGYVLIEYTVTRTGAVSDVVVVESSSEVFEQPALDAVSQFKYKPRVVDGDAVPVRGVRARMRFVLEA